MQDPAFSAPGRFFKGNLHTHSNRSDGALAPQEVCKRYRENGYDFIALTDHFVGAYDYPITDTTTFRTKDFTTILGAELHSGAMENGEIWHILAAGLPADFTRANSPDFKPIETQESGAEIAERAAKAGAFVAIAHPEWSGLTIEDAKAIEHAHAVEIYNHGCEVECDRGRGFYVLDQLLSQGTRKTLCATDDAHFHVPDHFGGWVMVKAEANDPDLLLEALKSGHHYSSNGPEIYNIVWHPNSVEVECSPASNIVVLGYGSRSASKNGSDITQANIETKVLAHSSWLRLVVTDAQGKSAWSNPVYRDQL